MLLRGWGVPYRYKGEHRQRQRHLEKPRVNHRLNVAMCGDREGRGEPEVNDQARRLENEQSKRTDAQNSLGYIGKSS